MKKEIGDSKVEKGSPVRRGIQSVEIASSILLVLADAKGPLSLKAISGILGMPASKMHRYLSSFVKTGLVRQDTRSSVYDLGEGAVRIGLAAVARMDLVNIAAESLSELVATTGMSAILCIWGTQGPTVVRLERSVNHIITSIGLGTTLSVANSATGRVFLAYLPAAVTENLIKQEQEEINKTSLERQAAKTVQDGYAAVSGKFIPGLVAVGAPVLNWQGEAEAVITLYSNRETLLDPNGPVIPILLQTCRSLSMNQR